MAFELPKLAYAYNALEPNLDAINEAIQWARDTNFKIPSETRDKILSLSFNRLANLIKANLP